MISDWVSLVLLLSSAGIFGGFLAGLFGIGGGLVIVPALYFILQHLGVAAELAMTMAVQSSLVSIIFTSLSSLRAHHKLGNVDWALVKLWFPATVSGALLAGAVVAQIRSNLLTVLFACLLLVVAVYKFIYPQASASSRPQPRVIVQRAVAAAIGVLSVCVGVGGGAISVPAMLVMGVPIHRAIGSSAALGFAIALPGSIAILLFSQSISGLPPGSFKLIYLPALIILLPLTILFAPLGAKFGKKLNARVLNRLFVLLLCFIAAKMGLSALT